MPELDSLRGVAIIGVIFLHGFYWQYSKLHFGKMAGLFLNLTQPGWLGVNLFFVLSGFLITGILLDSAHRDDYYKRFYIRRSLRILPAYYTLLFLLGILRQARIGYLGLALVYMANVTEFFGVTQAYGPLWSLAVEEHFYLLWPTIIHRLSRRGVAAAALAVCAAVPLFRGASFSLGHKTGLGTYTWFVADGLASGALIAVYLRTTVTRSQVRRTCVILMLTGVLLGIAGGPFGIATRDRLLGAAFQYTIINIIFSGILLSSLVVGTASWGKAINNSILGFFGYISYGLYLIHLLVFRLYDAICQSFVPSLEPRNFHFELVVLRFTVAASAAVAIAYVSRVHFEQWFLEFKDRFEVACGEDLTKIPAQHSGSNRRDVTSVS